MVFPQGDNQSPEVIHPPSAWLGATRLPIEGLCNWPPEMQNPAVVPFVSPDLPPFYFLHVCLVFGFSTKTSLNHEDQLQRSDRLTSFHLHTFQTCLQTDTDSNNITWEHLLASSAEIKSIILFVFAVCNSTPTWKNMLKNQLSPLQLKVRISFSTTLQKSAGLVSRWNWNDHFQVVISPECQNGFCSSLCSECSPVTSYHIIIDNRNCQTEIHSLERKHSNKWSDSLRQRKSITMNYI